MAGLRDFLFAGIAANHVRAHPVIIGYAIDNQFRRDAFGIAMNVDVAQRERNDFFVDVTVVQLRIGVYAGQRTFQLADVALDAPGDQLQHFVADFDVFVVGLFAQNGDSGVEIRLLNVGNQAPFKAAAEPLFQTGDFARRLIGRNDDLLARAVQGVERVEKLFLAWNRGRR